MHSEQDVEADRFVSLFGESGLLSRGRSRGSKENDRNRSDEEEEEDDSDPSVVFAGPRGIIVLFLKHVHLQKVGAAMETG